MKGALAESIRELFAPLFEPSPPGKPLGGNDVIWLASTMWPESKVSLLEYPDHFVLTMDDRPVWTETWAEFRRMGAKDSGSFLRWFHEKARPRMMFPADDLGNPVSE